MPLQKRLYSLGVHKCEWEETFGGLFDRTMAMSRSTVVKTEISPSDLGAHHIVDLDTPTMAIWQSVADKSISNQKGVSKQTVGLFLQISDIKSQQQKKNVSNVTKYGMRDKKGWSKKNFKGYCAEPVPY